MVEMTRAQLTAGNAAPSQRKRYREISKRIKTIVEQYHERHMLDYLRGIAINFRELHLQMPRRSAQISRFDRY